MKRIAVLGLGSVLMGDDGVGPFAVELLDSRWRFPAGVTLLDLGTPGPDLADYLVGLEAALVVDAIRAPGRPGEVRVFRGEEIDLLPNLPRISPHDPNLRQALLTVELAGQKPGEVILVGVIPERVELGTELSAPVRAALPELEAVLLEELRRLGVPPDRRVRERSPRTWWSREDPVAPGRRDELGAGS